MIYAMSDLHGQYEKFGKLPEQIHFSDSGKLYILGDTETTQDLALWFSDGGKPAFSSFRKLEPSQQNELHQYLNSIGWNHFHHSPLDIPEEK